MTEMERLAAPLRAALEAKAYTTLTPVQSAVLAEGLGARDLLVSAQTGSGKTVAFGLAIAPTIFPETETPAAAAPLALIIAPTRELALQVRGELSWLFADAVIASCVGGMDFRNERWALQRGAHVVVGTPGRLRDHVERDSLDLSGIRAVVLDEADEMLDMGFAEDLDFLLGRTPEERRVLMFSATVPEGIARLAARYQKDAARLEVMGEARQHADIDYQAIRVTRRDRDAAVFNLLRWHDAPTALVFARTRAEVSHLHARMANRGFAVVALSGELSQTERLATLKALRDGRARVCIATDVAARGIDLPGLDLVIHADLPANAEVLLHRSGRTGRAGRKGTSVLIVTQAETGRAGRLLHAARVVPHWARAPGADAVREREDARLVADAVLVDETAEEAGLAAEILNEHGPEAVAAAFVRLWRSHRSAPEELAEDLPPPAPAATPRDKRDFGDSVWFRLPIGRDQRAEARWLLPKICEAGGISRDGIGAIRVSHSETFVQIAAGQVAGFAPGMEIAPGVAMERLAGAPDAAQPRAFAPGARPDGRPHPPERDAPKGYPRKDHSPRPRHHGEEGKPMRPRGADEDRHAHAPRTKDGRPPYQRSDERDERPRAPHHAGKGEQPARNPRPPHSPATHAPDPHSSRRAPGYTPAPRPADTHRERPARDEAESGERVAHKPQTRPFAKPAPGKGAAKFAGPRGKPGGARPYKAGAPAGGKPWARDSGEGPDRKVDGSKKRPFAPKRADPRDTSKRFTPPKGKR